MNAYYEFAREFLLSSGLGAALAFDFYGLYWLVKGIVGFFREHAHKRTAETH